MNAMPGPRFCSLAVRLGAYQGAVAARFAAEQEDTGPAAAAPVAHSDTAPSLSSRASGVRDVSAEPAALMASEIGDMFSFGTAHA